MGDKKVAGGGGEKNEEEAFKTFQEKRARDSVILSLSLSLPFSCVSFQGPANRAKKIHTVVGGLLCTRVRIGGAPRRKNKRR